MEDTGDGENNTQQQIESLPKWMRYLPSGKYIKVQHKKKAVDKDETRKTAGKKRSREFDDAEEPAISENVAKTISPILFTHSNTSNTNQVDGIQILFGEENRHDARYVSKKAKKEIEEVSSLEVAKLLEFCDFSKC